MEGKEFEEMRQQIAILKEKLDNQQIVNDKLIKQSMRNNVRTINRMAWRTYACVVFVCILMPIFHFTLGFSWPFVIGTIALMLFCAVSTWHINRPINDPRIYIQDVATTSITFSNVKKNYNIWLHYITPAITIPWVAWYCYEYARAQHLEGVLVWIMSGMIIFAALVGLLIGYIWHRKTVNACDEVIEQLN